jgi:hypothetical protein
MKIKFNDVVKFEVDINFNWIRGWNWDWFYFSFLKKGVSWNPRENFLNSLFKFWTPFNFEWRHAFLKCLKNFKDELKTENVEPVTGPIAYSWNSDMKWVKLS